ncbi:ribonuclease J [Rhodospirillaceae bacterium SYSU D60014]|uniref:ribonuclease J n=1 Tax=Virgifigura deserti TaxID=2268457 RepID=UPI000E65F98B
MIERPSADELLFLPLGGAGEIGMNLNLYGHAGKWLMVDLGITFGDESTPGIDVIMPDPQFIVERSEDLAGLVLTHAHEDHIGAVPYLWPQLRCPIYATPFTASVLRRKLVEAGLQHDARITEVPMSGRFTVGPFEIELITLTHSIPEPNAVVVRTPLGTVLHTGDWKLDPEPLVGPSTDEAALQQLGDEGVLALIGDSTNVMVEGQSGSEAEVRESLMELVGRFENRVAVASFASNVARLETLAHVAAAHDRHLALVGRSFWHVNQAARENGYLTDLPEFVTEQEVGYLPRDKVLMACTGSQGEPRSALARIARNEHPSVTLEKGDAVIFSSRIIPGNERSIGHLQNNLVRLGVDIVTEREHFVHVSGHPARDELAAMYRWIRPKIAVPVHGELRHLSAHAEFAESLQVGQAVVAPNGSVVRLAPGAAEIIDEAPVGRLGLDGKALVSLGGSVLRSRQRALRNGSAVATLVVDREGSLIAEPQIAAQGLLDPERDQAGFEAAVAAIRDAIEGATAELRRDDAALKEAARLALRRALQANRGKKPVVDIHLVRV